MIDVISYEMGKKKGKGLIELSGNSDYTFTDTSGEGDIVIEEVE